MRALRELGPAEVHPLRAVAFDLDDTLLDQGELSLEAYAALFALRTAGLELVAITGRPAGWAELAARLWPIDLAIGENGAVAFRKHRPGVVERLELWAGSEAQLRRGELDRIVAELRARFAELELADDNHLRSSDVSFDIGEHRSLPMELVERVKARAAELGARSTSSRIHLHVTLSELDKASGYARAATLAGRDGGRALAEAAYVGDSLNDAPAFAAFGLPLGVANVAKWVERLPVPPRYVATREAGAGFAEIASRLLELRGTQP